MSESDGTDDELSEIREQKRERLLAATESPGEPIEVEDRSHLGELREQYGLLLVDFYADWCGPCQTLEPTVETIAADTAAAVAKVDVDAHQELAREHSVRGVPALALFEDGDPVERLVGVQGESRLRELIERYG
jgi:thioredoxin 1